MRFSLALLAGLLCSPLFGQAPIRLQVDATDAPRRLFHVRMNLPASPGSMTLLYPEWIPGEHAPTGPIANLVGLKISTGGRNVRWRRDDVNMYAFHLDVPAGADAVEVAFDFIAPPDSPGFSSGSSTTSELAVISWNQVALYPQGPAANRLQYQASLRLPDGWKFGTALPVRQQSGRDIEFEAAAFNTLVDSPVAAGVWFKTVDLGIDRGSPHFLHIAADSSGATSISEQHTAQYKRLIAETGALFGSRPYRGYHFLLTLSEHVAHFGLEHHESSDNRTGERALIDESARKNFAGLLPHEMAHSWNGKYRRPAGMVGTNGEGFDFPMKGELLWVYEGLTTYLGDVLTSRSGLLTAQEYLESLAMDAAALNAGYGRTWRPLEDTAVNAQVLYEAGGDYANYRRGTDFYAEGGLIWLEADVMIRQLSKGAKSLDDFCRNFFGGPSGAPGVKPYGFEDVIAGLNAVQPYDWASFFRARLTSNAPQAPMGGIERGGWKLVFDDEPSGMWKVAEEQRKVTDLSYSLGLKVKEDGSISDVVMGGPAQRAGVAPAMTLVAVNNRQFTARVLRDAVRETASGPKTLELLVKTGEYYQVRRVEYQGGEKYPRLIRDSSAPDVLSRIVAPLAKN